MKRIICIGNRYIPEDAVGIEVYNCLLQSKLPPDIEVIDGGLGGLNLLRFITGATHVIFVDKVEGFSQQPNEIVLLQASEVAALAKATYDHSAGLPYLVRTVLEVYEDNVPYMILVGIEGTLNKEMINKAVSIILKIIETEEVRNGQGGTIGGKCPAQTRSGSSTKGI